MQVHKIPLYTVTIRPLAVIIRRLNKPFGNVRFVTFEKGTHHADLSSRRGWFLFPQRIVHSHADATGGKMTVIYAICLMLLIVAFGYLVLAFLLPEIFP